LKNALLIVIIFSFCIGCKKDNPIDPKPDNFESVTIGTQVWMLKNLNVDHYRNGDPIPEVKDSLEWAYLETGAWCYYNNDPALGAIYGKLYNWYAVHDPRGLAPVGWHVPSDSEWSTFTQFLGGEVIAGGKLKEEGINHWLSPNWGATNESGFSALPGGIRNVFGYFLEIGDSGNLWSYTEFNASTSCGMVLQSDYTNVIRYVGNKGSGFSVRCIKD
jgi:uncharacterized protein (TIGR02145 family)